MQQRESFFTGKPEPSLFSFLGYPPKIRTRADLTAERDRHLEKIDKDEEYLLLNINREFNWDDPHEVPKTVQDMIAFLKRNTHIRSQIDNLFAYYYKNKLPGHENPLFSKETDDRTKDLTRISFLLNLIRNRSYGEHDKYMGYNLGDINNLFISVIMRTPEQRDRDERLESAIAKRELETAELEGKAEDLKEEDDLERVLGTGKMPLQPPRIAKLKAVQSSDETRRLQSLHPYTRGGKKKRRSTCKTNRKKRKRNKTRHRLRR
jgi:hypothetical protein